MKALIMAGGQGTRFWPLSRENRPKQFLHLRGDQSLLRETAERMIPLLDWDDIFVVAGPRYVSAIQEELPELGNGRVIVEPAPRNTAPCVALAAERIAAEFPDEVLAVLASDHVIRNTAEFHRALTAAETVAREGWLVTFGIKPSFPSTGFGYLRQGPEIRQLGDYRAHRVDRFIEKPDLSRAREFVDSGIHFWNSGMFVWKLPAILGELNRWMPELVRGLDEMRADPNRAEQIFAALPKVSIDYGVMEQTEKAAMIACDFGWSDVGRWSALTEIREADEAGNILEGDVEAVDSSHCIVHGRSGKTVALLGVHGLVVVDAGDALLVCAAERSEEVRRIVDRLKAGGRTDLL